jgi:tripartite-type tricarboxylate transporter receptor subunit TctC
MTDVTRLVGALSGMQFQRANPGMKATMTRAAIHVGVLSALLFGSAQAGLADEIADFYKGKQISIVVGHQVGTGFDTYARLLAPHLGRHIPGNPSIVVQNMVGASGLTAVNWLANVAPKDGTVMATFVQTVAFEPVFGNDKAQYDPAKLSWIGNMEESVGTCGVTRASGITSLDDLMTKEAVFGGTGATGPLGTFAQAIKGLTGAKIKVVYGYRGSADVKLAMNRGEVQGICGLPLSTIKPLWGDEYKSGEFRPIVQLSGRPHPELKGIPTIDSYAKTEEDRQVFGLIFGAQALGRVYVSPPGQPASRTKALRDALMAAMKDEKFLADAAKAQVDIEPMSGEQVAAFIAQLSAVSPAVVARAKQALSRN